MSLTKTQLIGEIYKAFEAVTLEDGVGLWEGWALDERLQDDKEYLLLKAKDERDDWRKIPVLRLYECSSSISFLDAKGMRFHLPLYLLFALDVFMDEEDKLHENKDFNLSPPEVRYALINNLESDYSRNRFSLLNSSQIQCVLYYLEFVLEETIWYSEKRNAQQQSRFDENRKKIEDAIALWKVKSLILLKDRNEN